MLTCGLVVAAAGATAAGATGDSGGPLMLTNTPAAPGAAGSATLLGGGTNGASLSLETRGLDTGNYEISAISKSDGATLFVAAFVVHDPTASPDVQAGQSRKEDNATHQSTDLASRTVVQLPPGLDANNFAQIIVTRLGGSVVLAGKAPGESKPANLRGTVSAGSSSSGP